MGFGPEIFDALDARQYDALTRPSPDDIVYHKIPIIGRDGTAVTHAAATEDDIFHHHLNVWVLDNEPDMCAQDHCDAHLETAAHEYPHILDIVHDLCSGEESRSRGHRTIAGLHAPFVEWARLDVNNYIWLWELTTCVWDQYWKRFQKRPNFHVNRARISRPPNTLRSDYTVPFAPPQQLPDAYCITHDRDKFRLWANTINAYRDYYIMEVDGTWQTGMPVWYERGVTALYLDAAVGQDVIEEPQKQEPDPHRPLRLLRVE